MEFQVTDLVRMKKNLKNIDTYGISPCILTRHKNTVFRIREVHEDEYGGWLRFYGLPESNELRMAYWNPKMFVKVEGRVNYDKESIIQRIIRKSFKVSRN